MKKLSMRDNPDYLQGLIDGYGGEEPKDELPHGFKDINEVYDRLNELRPFVKEEVGTTFKVERIDKPKNVGSITGPGLYDFLQNNESNESNNKIKTLVESFWKGVIDNLKPGEEGVVCITNGWSTSDENDPNRYMVEAYEIGGRMPVLTGRGGMKNLLNEGYLPLKVFFNRQPMNVDHFMKQFKELTHE